ncbi:MAG: hypothetical protein ABIV47_05470 [Roseiflexaceae bacterium]
MKTIELADQAGDWQAIIAAIETSGDPVALAMHGTLCGILLPTQEAHRAITRYTPAAAHVSNPLPSGPSNVRDYLHLLRDDPTLVPVVDGQPLEFVTMMNSSYINPEQIYQFKHPTTRRIMIYRASELREAIGRWFSNVDFIPARPKDFVEGKQ